VHEKNAERQVYLGSERLGVEGSGQINFLVGPADKVRQEEETDREY
jgi:hypothetical protein